MNDRDITETAENIWRLASTLDCKWDEITYRLGVALPDKVEYSHDERGLVIKPVPISGLISEKEEKEILEKIKWLSNLEM